MSSICDKCGSTLGFGHLWRPLESGPESMILTGGTAGAALGPQPVTEQQVREIMREELRSKDQGSHLAADYAAGRKPMPELRNKDQSGEVAELGATLGHDSEATQRVATSAMSDKRAVTGTPGTTSPDPTPFDDLVERLRRHCNKCLRCCDERAEAAARIVELEERLELTASDMEGNPHKINIGVADGIACRDATIALQDRELERAEAENAKLRRVVEAAKAMRAYAYLAEGDVDTVFDFDAALKELDAPRPPSSSSG